jgi:hypothetical protein
LLREKVRRNSLNRLNPRADLAFLFTHAAA